jgi:polysaccharide export outer membrane protein
VGRLAVAGLSVSEVVEKVRQLLPNKLYRRRSEDGREFPVAVAPDEVTIRVLEYRPVYLNGDIAKPGEQALLPGMTVRQAVALAGGFDFARFRMTNPFLELSDLRGEYDRLWIDFARAQIRVARLKAELNGRTEIDRSQLLPTPLANAVVQQIEQGEVDQFASRKVDLQKERIYLEASIKREQGRAGILTEQQKREVQGTDFDAEDLERVTDLYKKGTIPITRPVEARRSILLSSTRVLQTQAGLASVERELEEFRRKLQKLDDHRRLELTAAL